MSDIGHECDTRGEGDMIPLRKPKTDDEAIDQQWAVMTWDQHASDAIRLLEYVTDCSKRPDRGNLPAGEFDRRDRINVSNALAEAVEHAIAARDAR
jgi:hypothetical protein